MYRERLNEHKKIHYTLIFNAGFIALKQLFYNSRKRCWFVCGDHFSRQLISSSMRVQFSRTYIFQPAGVAGGSWSTQQAPRLYERL